MAHNPYHELPIEMLYELLSVSIKEMLLAMETHEEIGFRSSKKQVELLLYEIDEKKKEKRVLA